MAKLSPEERKALEDQLAADDADDDDDEVEVGFADGSYFKGKFRRAEGVASARGFKLRPDPSPETGDDKPKGGSNVKRFSGRRVS